MYFISVLDVQTLIFRHLYLYFNHISKLHKIVGLICIMEMNKFCYFMLTISVSMFNGYKFSNSAIDIMSSLNAFCTIK